MNQNSFNIKTLKVTYNKKVDINQIYSKIHKKFSLQEINQYAFVGYYKRKKNIVLVVFSNEKVFIDDENDKVPFSGVYTYKEIIKINFFENPKNVLKSYIEIRTKDETLKIKGINKPTFLEIVKNFNNQKDKYMKFFPEKIISGYREEANNDLKKQDVNSLLDEIEQSNHDNKNILVEEKTKNIMDAHSFIEEDDDKIKSNIESGSKSDSKIKKVVNDTIISNINTYSSSFLSSLFLAEDQILPSGQKTLFFDITKRLSFLEANNPTINSFDSVPFKLDKKALKLNTVPIIAELEPFQQTPGKEQYETRMVFTRNWIEYTKHNVTDKVLGVDSNGNGAYLDLSKVTSSKTIDTFKGKEYKINDEIRCGLRSSQTISAYEKNGRLGIDSLYFNKNTKKKLDIKKYDGIIFLGVKYYFGVYNEFSKLQREYTRIFVEDKKTNGEIYRRYELIFEDDLITYKAYNERGNLIDDLCPNTSSYDLKWLTFFKD